jgi:DNA polymerase III epsilon subunit-like protein
VKPSLYTTVSPFITELTGITTGQLIKEPLFPEVYQDFTGFIGDMDSVFCVWGKTDMKELFRNASYHNLNIELLTRRYINIQPYASLHLGLSKKKLLRLRSTVEALDIPVSHPFHDAGYDAYYTAEIFKKIYKSSMQPKVFEPGYQAPRPRTPRKIIDFDMLLHQFEKMYGRKSSGKRARKSPSSRKTMPR